MTGQLHYREWAPPPALRDQVRCVWALWGEPDLSDDPTQPIVPDGCPEIVLNLADPFVRTVSARHFRIQPRCLVVGPTTGPTRVGPTGKCRLVGIRLHPWSGSGFFGTPMDELRDALLPAQDVLGDGVARLHERLHARPPSAWARTVFAHLMDGGPPDGEPRARLAPEVVREIHARGGRVTVRDLARRFHASERTLERVLREDVGLPPVVLARILRLQEALATLLADPSASLARIALVSGYYDQPHFIREFRRLVGCAPSEFLRRERSLTECFIEGVGA